VEYAGADTASKPTPTARPPSCPISGGTKLLFSAMKASRGFLLSMCCSLPVGVIDEVRIAVHSRQKFPPNEERDTGNERDRDREEPPLCQPHTNTIAVGATNAEYFVCIASAATTPARSASGPTTRFRRADEQLTDASASATAGMSSMRFTAEHRGREHQQRQREVFHAARETQPAERGLPTRAATRMEQPPTSVRWRIRRRC